MHNRINQSQGFEKQSFEQILPFVKRFNEIYALNP